VKKCVTCGKGPLKPAEVEIRREVAEHVFTTILIATVCQACGEEYTSSEDLGRLELTIARALLDAGEASGEVFKFARKAMGLRAADLARLLSVTPETVSRWETGVHPIDPMALAVLSLLARDASVGATATLDALKARADPKPLAKRVTLKLAS
jgi:DNA-binding transcriptional regulator YiaG